MTRRPPVGRLVAHRVRHPSSGSLYRSSATANAGGRSAIPACGAVCPTAGGCPLPGPHCPPLGSGSRPRSWALRRPRRASRRPRPAVLAPASGLSGHTARRRRPCLQKVAGALFATAVATDKPSPPRAATTTPALEGPAVAISPAVEQSSNGAPPSPAEAQLVGLADSEPSPRLHLSPSFACELWAEATQGRPGPSRPAPAMPPCPRRGSPGSGSSPGSSPPQHPSTGPAPSPGWTGSESPRPCA